MPVHSYDQQFSYMINSLSMFQWLLLPSEFDGGEDGKSKDGDQEE